MSASPTRAPLRLRPLALLQAVLVIAALGVPVPVFADIVSVTPGAQSPSPVVAGSTATYSVQVHNGPTGQNNRGVSVTSISGLPSGATFTSTCAPVALNGTVTLTVTITPLVSTPADSYPLTMVATQWTANNSCTGNTDNAFTGSATLVVAAAPIPTTTVITGDAPDPSTVGSDYTVDVSVTRTSGSAAITGTVTVSDGTDSCTDTTPSGDSAATVTYSCNLTSTTAGAKTLTATYGGDSTFSGSSGTASHTVNRLAQATLEITGPASVTYGDAPFTPTTTGGSGTGAVTFDSTTPSVCTASGSAGVTIVGAGTCTVTATKAADGSYSATTSAPFDITVNKATSTTTVTCPASVAYTGSALTPCTATLSVAGFPDIPLIVSVYLNNVDVGTATATATFAGSADIESSTDSETFQITKADQTITFGALADKVVTDPDFTVSATASSGLAVTFSSATPAVCAVSGTTVHLVAVGTCTIDADQAGDASWNAAPRESRSFEVDKAGQLITFPSLPSITTETKTVMLVATTNSGLPVTYTSLTPKVCTVSGNIVTIVGTGRCTIEASQPGDATHNPAEPVRQSFTVASDTTPATDTGGLPGIVGPVPSSLLPLLAALAGVLALATLLVLLGLRARFRRDRDTWS
jgi:hypothetical protein